AARIKKGFTAKAQRSPRKRKGRKVIRYWGEKRRSLAPPVARSSRPQPSPLPSMFNGRSGAKENSQFEILDLSLRALKDSVPPNCHTTGYSRHEHVDIELPRKLARQCPAVASRV